MLISSYIAIHGEDAVATALQSDPNFAIFNLCWHSPADILSACNALGLTTVEEASAFALSLKSDKAAVFAALARPRPILSPDAPVTVWPEIHNMFGDAGLLAPTAKVDHSDRNYKKPSYDECVALANAFPGRNRKYIAEALDCDDYVDEFIGWTSGLGYGGYAFGFAAIMLYNNDYALAYHAVVSVLTRDRGLMWIEPQGGHVLPLDYKMFAGQWFCNRVLTHRLIF